MIYIGVFARIGVLCLTSTFSAIYEMWYYTVGFSSRSRAPHSANLTARKRNSGSIVAQGIIRVPYDSAQRIVRSKNPCREISGSKLISQRREASHVSTLIREDEPPVAILVRLRFAAAFSRPPCALEAVTVRIFRAP